MLSAHSIAIPRFSFSLGFCLCSCEGVPGLSLGRTAPCEGLHAIVSGTAHPTHFFLRNSKLTGPFGRRLPVQCQRTVPEEQSVPSSSILEVISAFLPMSYSSWRLGEVGDGAFGCEVRKLFDIEHTSFDIQHHMLQKLSCLWLLVDLTRVCDFTICC